MLVLLTRRRECNLILNSPNQYGPTFWTEYQAYIQGAAKK